MWKDTLGDWITGILGLFPMKQLLALILLMGAGSIGAFFEPFWGVMLYYTLAVLRPHYLWEWALPFEVRWSMIAALVALFSVVLHSSRVFRFSRINLIAILIGVYVVLLTLSTITAHDTATAQRWGIEYGKVLLMALVTSLVVTRMWHVRTIAAMVLVTLGYISWEFNYLYLFDGRLTIFHKGYNGLDNNGAGLVLSMGLPFAFVFGITAKHKWQRVMSWLFGLFILHAVLMSYSRGAMISASVGVFWLLLHYRPRLRAVTIAVALCIAVSVLAGQEIRDRFMSTAEFNTDGSAQSRLDSWAAAWQVTWDKPFTGQGIRNSNQYLHNYGADRQGRTIHSQYLQVAADSGILTAGVYITMLILALNYLGHTRRRCLYQLNSATDPRVIEDASDIERLALGFQASLITFAFGGVFLSLEVVELPWLLLVVAGVFPGIARDHFTKHAPHLAAQTVDDTPTPTFTIPRRSGRGPVTTV